MTTELMIERLFIKIASQGDFLTYYAGSPCQPTSVDSDGSDDLAGLAQFQPNRQVLIRLGSGRIVTRAQDAQGIIDCIYYSQLMADDNERADLGIRNYVRDVSLPLYYSQLMEQAIGQ